MTEARFAHAAGRWDIRIFGHATGRPDVCAAISSILYALAGYLVNAADEGMAQVYRLQMDSGDVQIKCSGDAHTDGACAMAGIGLMQLAETFPEVVKAEYALDE